MLIYVSCISLILFLNYLACVKSNIKYNSLGEKYQHPNMIFFTLTILAMLLLYSLRGWTGTDTGIYNSSFKIMSHTSLKNIYLYSHDWLFYVLQWFNYRIFSGNLICNNMVIGAIVYIPILITYVKYSGNYKLALMFYIITSSFFFAFNGQRQAVAMSIIFAGYPLLVNKKYIPYTLIILFAYNFHSTALLMIPIMFLLTRKTNSKVFIFTTLIMTISSIFLWQLWDSMFELLGMLGQERLVDEYSGITAEDAPGANILRLLVTVAPAAMGIIFYNKLESKNNNFHLLLNNAILGSVFMLAATRTWYFARLTTYFSYTTPILLIELSKVFNKRSKKIYYICIAMLFIIYLYFYLRMDSNLLPYNFNFKRSFY